MRLWLLACACLASGPAWAGLFADDDARKQIQQMEARIAKLEQALASAEQDKEQGIRSMLDLQMQMEALNTELRKLNGRNEELVHSLEDAEKRQKDFYIDLDTRLRRVESGGAAQAAPRTDSSRDASGDPQNENRAFESAYTQYKAENYQGAAKAFAEFLKKYPQSVHEANVLYWLGNSNFLLKDCKSSLENYQMLIGNYPDHPRVPESMLNMADCQINLKSNSAAKKTLKQVISRFPGSDASDKAKKRLASIK